MNTAIENYEIVYKYQVDHEMELATDKQLWFFSKLLKEKTGLTKKALAKRKIIFTVTFEDEESKDYQVRLNSKSEITGWKFKQILSKFIEALLNDQFKLV